MKLIIELGYSASTSYIWFYFQVSQPQCWLLVMITRDSKIKYYFTFTLTYLFSSTQVLSSIALTQIEVVLLESME